jgi:outer membrane protein OmpA-like peptidoglycan-associated protein
MHRISHRRTSAGTTTTIAQAVLALLLGTLATSCGSTPSGKPIVMATSATANEPAPTLGADDLRPLKAAANTDDASVLLVGPDGGTARMPLTPRRDNGQVEHGPRRDELIGANVKAVQTALARQAAIGPFDLLETVNGAARSMKEPGTLYIVSSGLSTVGGLDMRQVLWGANPEDVVRQLKDQRLLPSLNGWDVVYTGLGNTMPPQQPLPAPQRKALAAYWTAICQATDAASCTVNEEPRETKPSRSTVPVPTVPVPEVRSVQGPHDTTITTLPADMLFAYDSAQLDQTARDVLMPLAGRIRADRLRVTVTGYASPDGGTPAYNRELSLRRSHAVAEAIAGLGAPREQFDAVTGVGTDADPSDAGRTNGQLDPAKCAQLRRVVVTTHPSPDAATS